MRKHIALAILFLTIPMVAFAQVSVSDTGLNVTGNQVYDQGPQKIGDFIGDKIVKPVFAVTGVIFLLMIIYGGLLWMTAMGKPEQVTKAKNILVQSILGTVIIVMAYAITRFVFNSLT